VSCLKSWSEIVVFAILIGFVVLLVCTKWANARVVEN
jgi:hypothetical protein